MRVALVALTLAGCVQSATVFCDDGRICPEGTVCDPRPDRTECLAPEVVQACDGSPDGEPCEFTGIDGICRDGVCNQRGCGDGIVTEPERCEPGVAFDLDCTDYGYQDPRALTDCLATCVPDLSACTGVCGDLERGGNELCDGDDLGGLDCTDFGYYAAPGLACKPLSCLFDTDACTGGSCGDGAVNGPELCEPTAPVAETCVDLGFDAGRIGCSQACAFDVAGCRAIGWRTTASGTPKWLYGMWGAAADDVWAVGALGGLTHWDGTTWTQLTPPSGSKRLRGVWGAAADDVWVVGEDGTILHFDGAGWTQDVTLTAEILRAVWGTSASNVWAVGEGGVLLHHDGTAWSDVSGTIASGGADLQAIRGTAADDVWLAGDQIVAHYTGTWSVVTVPDQREWRGVYPRGIDDVFLVGGGTGGKFVRHWDGVSWVEQVLPTTHGFNAVGAYAGDEVVAVGNTGTIAHYKAGRWLVAPTDSTQSLYAVWDGGPRAWAAGESGTLFTIAGHDLIGEIWSPSPSATDLFAIHGTGPDDIWIAGTDGFMARFDGLAWTVKPTAMPAGSELLGLWAGPAPGRAISVGTNVNPVTGNTIGATICEWDGAALTKTTYAGAALLGVWGAAADDVWAAGDNGRMFHRDATSWTDRTADVPVPSITFKDVWGTDATHVFALGGDGNLARYTGAWDVTLVTPAGLIGAWGSSATDVHAVGGEGVIAHYDGASWTFEDSGTTEQLIEIHGDGDHVLAVGRNGLILELRDGNWSRVRAPQSVDLNGVYVSGDTAVLVADDGTLFEYRWY